MNELADHPIARPKVNQKIYYGSWDEEKWPAEEEELEVAGYGEHVCWPIHIQRRRSTNIPMPYTKNRYRESSVEKEKEWNGEYGHDFLHTERIETGLWCLLLGWCRSSIHNVLFLSLVSVNSKIQCERICVCVSTYFTYHASCMYFEFDDFCVS